MTLDEINDYLIEHKGLSEAEAYEIAIELMGKSMDEVDAYLDRMQKVHQIGKPVDNTQVHLVNQAKVNLGNTHHVGVKIDGGLKKEIQRQANELNMSVSALIRSVLQGYFK